MKIKFDLIVILKAILIIFILIGLGFIFLLYKTRVSSITAWVTVVLVTAELMRLYFVFFSGYTSTSSNTITKLDKSADKIRYSIHGFEVLITEHIQCLYHKFNFGNELGMARRYYNVTVRENNTMEKSFPGNKYHVISRIK
jgi:hypothetical protein